MSVYNFVCFCGVNVSLFALICKGENFDFDTTLKDACSSDAQTLCNSVSPGDAEVVECLREHDAKRKVSERCHQQLHKEEKLEVNMPEVDYKLMTICKASISKFCEDASAKDLLYCLEDHKLNMGFDVGCQRVVTERQIEAGRTIDLDPRLLTACRMDIPKFCRNKKPQEGEVIPCLKNALDKRMSLSPTCKTAVQQKEKESLLNVHVDAQFFDACKQEKVLEKCLQLPSGAIDCLRHLFGSNKAGSAKEISNQKCIAEIGRLMNEGVADVHNDPLLFTSCALDLQQYCNDIPFGTGKKIICLLEVYTTNKPHKLSVECSQQVSLRVEMWDTAVKVAPPNSFPELASLILSSQARGAFLSTGTLVIVILLILGCYVGRKCRRRRKRGKKL
ncbi:Golgi apparatus protein 1-like [Corticium candelabrum]|uniref:Golgi apparatus protein 1-like n=1 Tax=Corticium candelabrum TaxID=121492 RepID=UPI002E261736|nr:Golgi apparatus protein 1-like [Corticium candelabrum]